jgi:hypothetical protein
MAGVHRWQAPQTVIQRGESAHVWEHELHVHQRQSTLLRFLHVLVPNHLLRIRRHPNTNYPVPLQETMRRLSSKSISRTMPQAPSTFPEFHSLYAQTKPRYSYDF